MAAFELSLVSEKNFKKELSGEIEIAFALLSLFHVQIEDSASRSTTTRAFFFLAKFAQFYYHKIFEQVDDDLSICVDERSPCGL